MTTTTYPEFRWPLRVYIEDTDAGGIVYYVNYLKFMERARTEYLRSMGFDHYMRSPDDFMFVVADAQVSYKKPALMDDDIVATAQVLELGRASLRFAQTIQRASEVLTQAEIKIGCVTKSSRRPRAIPPQLVELIQRTLEGYSV